MKPISALLPVLLGAAALLSPAASAKSKPDTAKPDTVKAAAAKPAAPAPALSQEEAGRRAIYGILRNEPVDSIARSFEEGALENLTEENLQGFRGQIEWLPRFIGDSVVVFMTGTEIPDSAGRTAFFREYRFANESSKRAPLMIVHLYFVDSTTPKVSGAYNKTFDDDTRNRVADAQVWKTGADSIEVHSVTFAEINNKLLPIVRVFDEDTVALDSARAVTKASPVAREAIARGFLQMIQKAKPGMPLMHRFGVSLLRRDPHRGYVQVPIALHPADYGGEEDSVATPPVAARKAAPAKTGSKAATGKPAKKKAK